MRQPYLRRCPEEVPPVLGQCEDLLPELALVLVAGPGGALLLLPRLVPDELLLLLLELGDEGSLVDGVLENWGEGVLP